MDPVAYSVRNSANRVMGLLVLTVVLFTSGCGSNRAPLGTIQGTVRYNGQPIAEGQILFEVAGARPAQGRILDGRIVDVTSYAPGDGAPLGLARIAVFATPPSGTNYSISGPVAADEPSATGRGPGAGGQALIPARYNDLETSGLSHELVAGPNDLTLELHD